MKAILVSDDSARTLYVGEVSTPEAGAGHVLIKIYATAVNRADLLQRRGLYPPPPGESGIMGLEAAGVIAAKGANVQNWRIGERVFCLLGGEYLHKNLSLLRLKGRLVLIGLLGGSKAEMDLALVLRKRLRILGSVLRSRTLSEKIAITAAFKARVLPLFIAQKIHPVIDSVYPLAEAEKAHAHVAANKNIGKVILRVA